MNASGGAKSEIYVGSMLHSNASGDINVTTGNLSSSVSAALGGTNGVFIGNISQSGRHKTTVHTGSHSAKAVACVKGVGCMSEIVGKKNCVMIGNVGMSANCGNDSLINEAIKELEHLGYVIEKGVVKTAKEVAEEAEKAAKAVEKEAEKIGKAIAHAFSGW